MKKSTITALVIIIPIIALGSLILEGLATANQNQFMGPGQEALNIAPQGITVNSGLYNISVAINACAPAKITKL